MFIVVKCRCCHVAIILFCGSTVTLLSSALITVVVAVGFCAHEYVVQALVKAQLKMGSDRESRKRPWEENELSSLAKAIVKFPAGSQNRE